MSGRRWVLGLVFLPLPAWAGIAIDEPAKPPPVTGPVRPRRPQAPPAAQLPGPLSESQRLAFDRLRTEGILHYRVGRYAEAAAYFRQALAIRPDDAITRDWLHAAEAAPGKRRGEGR